MKSEDEKTSAMKQAERQSEKNESNPVREGMEDSGEITKPGDDGEEKPTDYPYVKPDQRPFDTQVEYIDRESNSKDKN